MADKTEKKQRGAGRPFEAGQSGNPNGRPKGSRNKNLILLEQMVEGEAEAVCRVVIDQAKGGDMQAARMLMDRILPPKKDRPICLALPKMENTKSAMEATSIILNAMAEGEITPAEGEAFIKIIETYNKTAEIFDYEERLKAIEAKLNIDEGDD